MARLRLRVSCSTGCGRLRRAHPWQTSPTACGAALTAGEAEKGLRAVAAVTYATHSGCAARRSSYGNGGRTPRNQPRSGRNS